MLPAGEAPEPGRFGSGVYGWRVWSVVVVVVETTGRGVMVVVRSVVVVWVTGGLLPQADSSARLASIAMPRRVVV
jgi:hypothetical protein